MSSSKIKKNNCRILFLEFLEAGVDEWFPVCGQVMDPWNPWNFCMETMNPCALQVQCVGWMNMDTYYMEVVMSVGSWARFPS